jgi:sirohydrochlorin ferrochelatase
MIGPQTIWILLLGSYDSETRRILYKVKDEINKLSIYYDEYLLIPLLLENVEVYRVVKEDRVGLAILERYAESLWSLMIAIEGKIEVYDDVEGGSLEEVEEVIEKTYGLRWTRLRLLEKFRYLANVVAGSGLVIVIRHVELARCGELIELTFLLREGVPADVIRVLVNEEINVSSMLLELLRMYRIYWERYGDEEELLRIIRGIIQYFIGEIQSSRELL